MDFVDLYAVDMIRNVFGVSMAMRRSHGCVGVVELVGASRASLCACSWKPRARHWNERGERRKQKSENGKFAFGLSGGLCVEMSVHRVGKCNRKYHHIWQHFDKIPTTELRSARFDGSVVRGSVSSWHLLRFLDISARRQQDPRVPDFNPPLLPLRMDAHGQGKSMCSLETIKPHTPTIAHRK